ncbi:MAG: phosphate/phosphite/phosphonate ABC transporter substrate-binding protein [Anaerolineales bacterium]|nr:phosphate/phosphite/phosphonate ABC transporter substrate-binding protein [Anaerolineales bacterium]
MKTKRFFWVLIALLIVGSLVLGACGGAAEPVVDEPVADEPAEPMTGTYYERAMAGEFAGTVVSMTGPFTDEDAVKFDSSVAAFEEATGIDVQYEGSKEFEATITLRVDAGDAPDIVDFPQPGLLSTFVARGEVVDVSTFLPQSSFDNYNQSWWDMGTMAGPDGDIVAGVWHRFNAKSQVWYPQAEFEAAGYAIPETWDEMIALSDQIVADGDKPWCVGIESGAATGWPATDWLEEVMLRTTSLENYDAWVKGDLPFSSPEVMHALDVLTELWKDDYVYGGSEAIVTTFFGDAPTPMFEDPPKCWLHKQGNFITSFFPEGVVAGTDYGFFYLPGIDEAYGSPYLVAGDIMAMFNDRDEVRATMEFFTHGEAVKEWLAAGGALSMHMDTDLAWYGDDIEKGVAALVADATSVRFDGSDLMPGEVGAGSFWTGMTDYFSGVADAATVMAEIDASWPVAPMAAAGELGSAEAPIKVLFVPSVDVDFMIAGGELIEQALLSAAGLYVEVSIPTSYAATIEEMCASPTDTVAFIPAMGYALANQLCGVTPGLASERYGWNVYWTAFYVARDSDFQTLEDLEGASWAYPDGASTSGYLYPQALYADLGITVGETIEAGGHPQAVRAVYNGEADFGTAYFSAPLLPEGSWTVDMAPDIPDEFIPDCGLNDAGKLYCGDYRVLDARAAIREEAPDVVQKVRILDISPEIPNDTMSFSPDFPEDMKQMIIAAITAYVGTDACAETLCNESFYDWTGVGPIFDENFDGIRIMMEAQGITLENIGE